MYPDSDYNKNRPPPKYTTVVSFQVAFQKNVLIFTYLMSLCIDTPFPFITKFKIKQVSGLFICKSNTELNCVLID